MSAPIPRAERDAQIVARVAAGETLQSVAVDFGLTRERVRQLCAIEGVLPVRGGGRRDPSLAARDQKMAALLQAGVPEDKVAEIIGIQIRSLRAQAIARGLLERKVVTKNNGAAERSAAIVALITSGVPPAQVAAASHLSLGWVRSIYWKAGVSLVLRGENASQRDAAIASAVQAGATLTEAAATWGLSVGRIYQICRDGGIASTRKRGRVRDPLKSARNLKIVAAVQAGASVATVAEDHSLSAVMIYSIMRAARPHRPSAAQ